jgi:tetratricopeptide (TPR) repeat protein
MATDEEFESEPGDDIDVSAPSFLKSAWYRYLDVKNSILSPVYNWLNFGALAALVVYLAYQGIRDGFGLEQWASKYGPWLGFFVCWCLFGYVFNRWWARWAYLAVAPGHAMARGQPERAERAYQKAIAHANRFGPGDRRRGFMLSHLATFLATQGRREEARRLHEETVKILAAHHQTMPGEHITALANYAYFLTASGDYGAAIAILEKALDLLPSGKKADVAGKHRFDTDSWEFVVQLNLAQAFLAMSESEQADAHLDRANHLFAKMDRPSQKSWNDALLRMHCLCLCNSGEHVEAAEQLLRIRYPNDPTLKPLWAKIHISRSEFAAAEKLLRELIPSEPRFGRSDIPEYLDPRLDLAEALFGQGKRDEAFATFKETRRIVAQFAIPADAQWRKALATWMPRAKELGRDDVAAALEAELAAANAATDQAITTLEKFRVRDMPA